MSIEEFEATLKSKLVTDFAAVPAQNLYLEMVDWMQILSPLDLVRLREITIGDKYSTFLLAHDLLRLETFLNDIKIKTYIECKSMWAVLRIGGTDEYREV